MTDTTGVDTSGAGGDPGSSGVAGSQSSYGGSGAGETPDETGAVASTVEAQDVSENQDTQPAAGSAPAVAAEVEQASDDSVKAAAQQASDDAAFKLENPDVPHLRASNPDVGGEGFTYGHQAE